MTFDRGCARASQLLLWTLVLALSALDHARAVEPDESPDRSEPPRIVATPQGSCPQLTFELGVLTALPALLGVGQSLGGVAALTVGNGPFLYGVRASVSTGEEFSPSWRLDHTELRVRALGGVRAAAGRGTWILRLGLGMTVVNEARERHNAGSLALSNVNFEESAWTAVPAVELEGGLVLDVHGAWGLALFGGPTLHFGGATDGGNWGWTASGSVVWTP